MTAKTNSSHKLFTLARILIDLTQWVVLPSNANCQARFTHPQYSKTWRHSFWFATQKLLSVGFYTLQDNKRNSMFFRNTGISV